MSSMNDVARLKDIDNLADQTAQAINYLAQNGGSSSAVSGSNVLDTVPATVDGGLWRDFDGDPVIKMKCGDYAFSFAPADIASIDTQSDSLAPTSLPVSISGNIITVNSLRFQFNNFRSGISVTDGFLFFGGEKVGVVATDGDPISDFVFLISSPSVFDFSTLSEGDIISISAIDSLPEGGRIFFFITPSLFLPVASPVFFNKPFLRSPTQQELNADSDLVYVYTTAGHSHFVSRTKNAAGKYLFNSFSFHAETNKYIKIDASTGAINRFLNQSNFDDFFKIEIDGSLVTVSVLHEDFFGPLMFEGMQWIYFEPTDSETAGGKTKYTFTFEFDSDITPKIHDATLTTTQTATANEGLTYTYTPEKGEEGLYGQDYGDGSAEIDYYEDTSSFFPDRGFTLEGLASGLSVYKTAADTYKIAKTDSSLSKDTTTGYYTVTDANTLGTIVTTTSGNIKTSTVTISSLAAIGYTDTNNVKTYNVVRLTDIDGSEDGYSYTLTFDDKLLSPQPNNAVFIRDTNSTADNVSYKFASAFNTGYFTPAGTNRFRYNAATTQTTFGISGFTKELGGASLAVIDGNIYLYDKTKITKTTTDLGNNTTVTNYSISSGHTASELTSYGNIDRWNTINLNNNALPAASNKPTDLNIQIDTANTGYYLNIDTSVIPRVQEITEALTPQSIASDYIYTAFGSASGFLQKSGESSVGYALQDGGQSFGITGLVTGLQVYDIKHDNESSSGKKIIFNSSGSVTNVEVTAAALNNRNVTLTDSNSYQDGVLYSLALAADVNQLDSNSVPPVISNPSLAYDSSTGTATYTATSYNSYYYRVPSDLPDVNSSAPYSTSANFFNQSGGEQFTISGLNFVDGVTEQLVKNNISVAENIVPNTLSGDISSNFVFSFGSALTSKLQTGKQISISSDDTQNFSPTVVSKE